MINDLPHDLWKNFLGSPPDWYMRNLIALLQLNPLVIQPMSLAG